MFKNKNIELKTIVFAEDATAFVINEGNNINEIDTKTLGEIMSGKISNWKEVSGLNLPINIYGRQSSSGTHSFIRKKLAIQYSQKGKEMTGMLRFWKELRSINQESAMWEPVISQKMPHRTRVSKF